MKIYIWYCEVFPVSNQDGHLLMFEASLKNIAVPDGFFKDKHKHQSKQLLTNLENPRNKYWVKRLFYYPSCFPSLCVNTIYKPPIQNLESFICFLWYKKTKMKGSQQVMSGCVWMDLW